MSPANDAPSDSSSSVKNAAQQLVEFANRCPDWFMSEDGRLPLEITRGEFDFSAAHGRLFFSSWTQKGSRVWRVNDWSSSEEKLTLRVSRKLDAETATIELVPRASAQALIATIAAARQERCERLAQLMAEGFGNRVSGVENAEGVGGRVLGLGKIKSVDSDQARGLKDSPGLTHLHPNPSTQHPSIKIERANLSPGMRRDQPGRYARVILRLPHERIAVTAIVAQSDARNVDSLFSSTLLWFARLQSTPKRPPINRLLIVVEKNILEAARQRHVLLRDSLRQQIELWRVDDEWQSVEATQPWERRYLSRKRLPKFP